MSEYENLNLLEPEEKAEEKAFLTCPICDGHVSMSHVTFHKKRDSEEEVPCVWAFCECGTISCPAKVVEKFEEPKLGLIESVDEDHTRAKYLYAKQVYMPIIEELTYGRQYVEIDYGRGYALEWLKERGWLAMGLDHRSEAQKGDFPSRTGDQMGTFDWNECKVNVIWAEYVMNRQKDPYGFLGLMHQSLLPHGILYLSVPDTDAVHRFGFSKFGHWIPGMNRFFFRPGRLKTMLEMSGFDVILMQKNTTERFLYTNTVNVIAQKRKSFYD